MFDLNQKWAGLLKASAVSCSLVCLQGSQSSMGGAGTWNSQVGYFYPSMPPVQNRLPPERSMPNLLILKRSPIVIC